MELASVIFFALVKIAVWWIGAGYAWWRKRWAVTVGFFLAGIVVGLRAADFLDDNVLSATALPVATLIVYGFIANQPRRGKRPARWVP